MDSAVMRFAQRIGSGLLVVPVAFFGLLFNWIVGWTSEGKRTFHEPAEFPWISELESSFPSVRAELDRIADRLDEVPNYQDLSPEQRVLTQDDGWKSLVFYAFGSRIEANSNRCPATASLLGRIPGLYYAMFSILKPGKHIPKHRGYYRGLLNCHLALAVPSPLDACRLQVGPDVRRWEEGRVLIFDDYHPHEAWNDSEELRVVLLTYVERPLPSPWSALNRALLKTASRTSYVRNLVERARDAASRRGD